MLAVSVSYNAFLTHKLNNIPREQYIDTTYYPVPVPKDSLVVKYITKYLPVAAQNTTDDSTSVVQLPAVDSADSTEVVDSIPVTIPITQKHYKTPEYEAWVSGYEPKLDSCLVFEPTNIITHTTNKAPSIEVTLGINASVGWNGREWAPYFGLGVQIGVPLRKFYRK